MQSHKGDYKVSRPKRLLVDDCDNTRTVNCANSIVDLLTDSYSTSSVYTSDSSEIFIHARKSYLKKCPPGLHDSECAEASKIKRRRRKIFCLIVFSIVSFM